ncbi:MAG: hypothetical protein JXB32_15875 [Deltaproteobacteria bacterium]|nr:hypothetical protein [Deltaproteobacteria bacterium]
MRAKVDTGSFGTIVPRSVADEAGVSYTGADTSAVGVGNKRTKLREAEAKVCIPKCGCRTQRVFVANDGALHGEVLVGMDYLNGMRAVVDASNGRIRCRCRRPKKRSRR